MECVIVLESRETTVTRVGLQRKSEGSLKQGALQEVQA